MPKFDTFHLHVLEARNVAVMGKSGTSDPYCTIKSSFNKQTFKTKVVKKTLNPKWEQEFKIFTSKAEGQIIVKMMDKDRFSKDELMGEVTLPLEDFGKGNEIDKWYELSKEPQKKKKDKTIGELHLKAWFSGPAPEPEPEKKKPKEESKTEEVKEDKSKAKDQTREKRSDSKAEKTAEKTEKSAEKSEKPKKDAKDKEQSKEKEKPVKIEEKYELGKVIGRGAFSVVKLGVRKASGKKYAIKCISKKLIDKKELQLLEREIDIMKKLQHPNIIQLMEVVDTPETLYLVLEFAAGGELFDAIVNRGSYSEQDAARIIKQILEAILFVHAHGIAHRDLKPENLLLAGEEGQPDFIKIADFGLSKDFEQEQLQTSCGTPDYVAPEVLMSEPYDMGVDIWSIGVITYVLLCGFPPFYGDTQKELFENIMSGTYDFPDPEWTNVSEEAKNFIRKILVVDAEKRYNAEQCLADKWILDCTAPKREQIKRSESFSVKKFKQYNEKYKKENPGFQDPNPS